MGNCDDEESACFGALIADPELYLDTLEHIEAVVKNPSNILEGRLQDALGYELVPPPDPGDDIVGAMYAGDDTNPDPGDVVPDGGGDQMMRAVIDGTSEDVEDYAIGLATVEQEDATTDKLRLVDGVWVDLALVDEADCVQVCAEPLEEADEEFFDADMCDWVARGATGRVAEFFDDMKEIDGLEAPASKRRRLRQKGPEPSPIQRPPAQRLKHLAASRGLEPRALKRMIAIGLPMIILNALVFLETAEPLADSQRTECAEMYSGVASIAGAFEVHGYTSARYDEKRHELFENILSAEGFLTALKTTRNVRQFGLSSWATVCSSWVYLCRASTGRNAAFPEGDERLRIVSRANRMVARSVYLMAFGACLLIKLLHEQPLSSLMSASKYFCWLRSMLRAILSLSWTETITWMGAYNHMLQKPTQLLHTQRFGIALARKMTAEQRALCEARDGVTKLPPDEVSGRARVVGKPVGLKESQAYTAEYGESVFQAWNNCDDEGLLEMSQEACDSDEEADWDLWRERSAACAWPEARLADVSDMLHIPQWAPLP